MKEIPGRKVLLSGFGKNPEIVDVYVISDLKLKGENGDYRNLASWDEEFEDDVKYVNKITFPGFDSLSILKNIMKNVEKYITISTIYLIN